MHSERHIQILKHLKNEVHQKYKADLKGIFGSYARGDAKEGSDIDILAEFDEDATLFDLCGMTDFLEEKLHRKVDVVCPSAIREEIRPYIYNDLVLL